MYGDLKNKFDRVSGKKYEEGLEAVMAISLILLIVMLAVIFMKMFPTLPCQQ